MSEPAPPVAVGRAPDLAALGISGDRPLAIVDVDEVIGLFMEGFGRFLEARGLEFRVERFALFQNIYRPGAAEHLPVDEGKALFGDFFRCGCGDLEPTPGAAEALRTLSRRAEVLILSNAPGSARLARARWLGRHGLDYPLILNIGPKGPLTAGLVAQVQGQSAFVDDLLSNLDSVEAAAPAVHRFQHVADPRLRPLAPSAPDRHRRVDDWAELGAEIEAALARPA